MNELLFTLIIIISVGFLAGIALDILNLSNIKPELPGFLQSNYNPDSYRRSQSYLKEHGRFGLIVSVISFVALIVILVFHGFAWVNDLVNSITRHPVTAALFFFGILGFASDIAGIPFDLYSTFLIEEKYGFNKTTPQTFILDKLKSWLLAILIAAPIMGLIIWIYTLTGNRFWILAWIIISIFSILMTFFYSTLIVPLFNKQQPLKDGELRSAIEKMSRNAGFQLSKIFVINGSKRSTKSNAYFTGFGSKRRIVLYDTLINDLTTNQIIAVLAHEIGHYKKKHIILTLVLSVLQMGLLLYLFSWVVGNPALAAALNVDQPSFHINVLVFGILYSPVSMLTGLLFNYLSRSFEYQADSFAAKLGYSEELAGALIGLSEKNLSNLTPHPAYVFVHYSHPPLLQRLKQLQRS